ERAARAARLLHLLGRKEVLRSLLDSARGGIAVGHSVLRIPPPEGRSADSGEVPRVAPGDLPFMARGARAIAGSSSLAIASRLFLPASSSSRDAMCTHTVRQISVSALSPTP